MVTFLRVCSKSPSSVQDGVLRNKLAANGEIEDSPLGLLNEPHFPSLSMLASSVSISSMVGNWLLKSSGTLRRSS